MNLSWKGTKEKFLGAIVRAMVAVLSKKGYLFRLIQEVILQDEFVQSLSENHGFIEKFSHHKTTFVKLSSDRKFLNRLAENEDAIHFFAKHGWLKRAMEFERDWRLISDKLSLSDPLSGEKSSISTMQALYAANKIKLRDGILDLICDEEFFTYNEKQVRHSDRNSLWILIHEILVNEDYYFDAFGVRPKILDCGCHFGLATLYLKKLYPGAKVTAFEPFPEVYAIADENFKRSKLEDVVLLPFALSNDERTSTFYVSKDNPMGSSLENRFAGAEQSVYSFDVECRKLSTYLQEPIDLLKLDIEGAELVVLEEAREFLKNVHLIFVEVHILDRESSIRLSPVISLLESSGFQLHCSKSWTSQKRTATRPLSFVGEPLTHVIWGKNLNFINTI